MIKAIMIADDLTGAMDTAVHFAAAGLSTRVLVRLPDESGGQPAGTMAVPAGNGWLREEADVLAVNTDTRHLPADAAYRIVYALAVQAGKAGIPCVYKKTDSALRGNVGAELSALRRALGMNMLPFIPAYPRLGRTVEEGCLFINGVPAMETALGRDPIDPLTSSRVSEILGSTAPAGEASKILVFDAASREDLAGAAKTLGDRVFVCAGCGGFAEILAEKLSERFGGDGLNAPVTAEDSGIPQGGMLLICGSLHEKSLLQVEEAGRQGYPVRVIPDKILMEDTREECGGTSEPDHTADKARQLFAGETAAILASGKICILSTTGTSKDAPDIHKCRLVRNGVGRTVREICDTGCVKSLCIFGGDTLLAVMRTLQVDLMRIRREVQPGVVLGSIEYRGRTIPVITKAGSFGEADLIGKLLDMTED